jgi:capsular polysaccharide biosynthesis protein
MTLEEMLYALLRRWKLIAFGAVFTGLVALGVSFVVPPTYEAVSTVAIAKSTVAVNFDEKLRTLTEEELLVLFRREQDLKERRKALEGLVQNAAIAQKVIEQLGDQLPDRLRQPGELIKIVEGKLVGDSIEIRVRADNPTVAAAIANAWGREYEKHINSIYATTVQGEALPDVQREAARAWSEYLKAQEELQKFIAENNIDKINRLIEEKKAILTSLSEGQRQAVKTVVDTELEARSKIISAYVNALTDNLLLAFQKEQEEKRKLLTEFFAAEIQNRLLAFQKGRELQEKVFTALVDTEIQAKVAVLQQQIEDRTAKLANTYAQRRLLEQLLENAQAFRAQIKTDSPQATAVTNGLPILLLKIQAFASTNSLRCSALPQQEDSFPKGSVDLLLMRACNLPETGSFPNKLEFSLSGVGELAAEPQKQIEDLDALISSLQQQIEELNTSIKEQSTALLRNAGYDFLDTEPTQDDSLSQAIAKRYQELFEFGQLQQLGQQSYSETSLIETIKAKHPELFQIGEIAKLSDLVAAGNPLAASAQAVSERLLQLQGLEDIPTYTAAAKPLAEAIDKLDKEINALQAQLESEQARKKELVRARDLAWEKYNTLANKVAEVDVASAITGTEVRFAKPAFVPEEPVSPKKALNALLGLFAGLVLAMGFVLLKEHPLFNGGQTGAVEEKSNENLTTHVQG